MANLMMLFNFTPDLPGCHGNEIWDKIGYNSACIRHLRDFYTCRGRGFGDGPLNATNRIFSQPTPVAVATNFGTKWAITRHNVRDISEILPSNKGFGYCKKYLKLNSFVTDHQ